MSYVLYTSCQVSPDYYDMNNNSHKLPQYYMFNLGGYNVPYYRSLKCVLNTLIRWNKCILTLIKSVYNTPYSRYHRLLTITTIIRWSIRIVKKVVLLIASEGKKCRSDMHHTGLRGKMWEKVLVNVYLKWGKGTIPSPLST